MAGVTCMIAASTSCGLAPRGCVLVSSSQRTAPSPVGPTTVQLRIAPRTSSSTSRPLRDRVTVTSSRASRAATPERSSAASSATSSSRPTSTIQVNAVTISCNAGARSIELTRARDLDAGGQRDVQPRWELVELHRLAERDVEELLVALVARREGQSEAHLRPGREPLGERQRQRLDAERPLERACRVAM